VRRSIVLAQTLAAEHDWALNEERLAAHNATIAYVVGPLLTSVVMSFFTDWAGYDDEGGDE